MDASDRELLNEIQANFPVTSHPYRELGRRLGLDETDVLERVAALRETGIIRRLGASINSREIGFVSTLCAARVSRRSLERFVRTVNECPGVTHNYERKHEYNVWFTLIAASLEEKQAILNKIMQKTGISILELPASQIFKIRVDFRF